MSRKRLPEINAGSMADIAFLLLIFFLVTTTLHVDSGISKKLSKKIENQPKTIVKEKNILEIIVNKNNELFVEGNRIELKELKQLTIDFIDNGASLSKKNISCKYCNGKRLPTSSDHPQKAFISIETDRVTNYQTYISVLNEVNSGYTFLRNRLSTKLFQRNYESLLADFRMDNSNKEIQTKIEHINEKYPVLVSDLE